MVDRLIVGYRPHPAFKTLTQEIYECGHVHSAPTEQIEFAPGKRRRCIKCIKGMPADLRLSELPGMSIPETETPLLQRLATSLAYHLAETEKVRRSMPGNMPEIDSAIFEAHTALSRAGFKTHRSKTSKA